jgi:glycosyltransferase involved in cell wall biosynthesis
VDESRIHLVPNIVPRAEIDGTASRRDTGDEPIILFAGRFSSEKNVERLLDALALVFLRRSARAIFCGDGPLRVAMEQKARDLGIADRCLFLGEVSDVWSWMKSASVLVSVSLFEGEPNAVLEAIACGTPLVLSGIPAHRALVGESAARMVDAFSTDSIASGIEAALGGKEEAMRRARNALRAIEGRSATELAARYAQIYRGVLSGRT